MILIVALPLTNNGGRLAGYYMAQVSTPSFVTLLSLIASNVAGYTKKTTVAALFLIAYCAGNIIGRPSSPANIQCKAKDIVLQAHKLSMPGNLLVSALPRLQFLVSSSVVKESRPADVLLKVCWGLCVLDLGFIWWYYQSQNCKKAAIRAAAEYVKVLNCEWLDLTDRENPELIYTL